MIDKISYYVLHLLLGQALPLCLLAILFLVQVETFGHFFLFILKKVLNRFKLLQQNVTTESIAARLFIGLVVYTLVFFGIGLSGLLSKPMVLAVSSGLPILFVVITKRWRDISIQKIKKGLTENKYILLGAFAYLSLTFVFWFRPIVGFDGLWYQLVIPKQFLQLGHIGGQGPLVRYSLHPTMTYFWYLWPLSLPMATVYAGMVINFIQVFVVSVAIFFATKVGTGVWKWGKVTQIAVPLLLGTNYELLSTLGTGFNDMLGFAFGLAATLYCYTLVRQARISMAKFAVAIMLIIGLASFKIFFTVFATFLLVYLLIESWPKLDTGKYSKLLSVGLLIAVLGGVLYLPWLVRSYIETGRILDPVGEPGLNEAVYRDSGGGDARTHWTTFIFTRFYASVIPILMFVYSPLVLIGVIAMTSKKIRQQLNSLWFLGVSSFLAVFAISIALQWRYYLPSMAIITFIGVVYLVYISDYVSRFSRMVLWGTVGLLLLYSYPKLVYTIQPGYSKHDFPGNWYINAEQNAETFLSQRLSKAYDYVPITALKPNGVANKEKVFVANIHNLAYIENPILEPNTHFKDFQGVRQTADFIDLLRRHSISYLLVRGDISTICSSWHAVDYEQCTKSENFELILKNTEWGIRWYRLR